MNKLSVVSAFSVILFLFAPLSSKADVAFYDGDPSSAKATAKEEGKLYFIDFVANYCAPCRLMDETTYTDDRLAWYIKQNYVPVKVNVEDFDGYEWQRRYNVRVLPTIIILDANGKVLKRHEGSLTGSSMLAELKKYESNKQPPVSAPVASAPPPSKPKTSPPPPPVKSTSASSSGKGLFKFSVSKQESKGFGVQIGVFAEYGNVLTEVEKLQKKFKEPILVNINTLNGKTVYKIIVGAFYSQQSAINYRKDMRSIGVDGIIKDLSLLN